MGWSQQCMEIMRHREIEKVALGGSLAIQWLKLCASAAGSWVPSLVGGLRFYMLCDMAKKKKKKIVQDHTVGFMLGSTVDIWKWGPCI